MRAHAVIVAQDEFAALDVVEDKLPVPEALTLEQLLLVLAKSDELGAWLHSVRAHAQTTLEAGGQIPGWKLVPKRANRKWTDDDDVEQWARASTDLGDQVYAPRKLRSPAQIEKLLKGTKLALPSALVSKVSSGYNLAPDSDPRLALQPLTAENEFKD
jgi:hypothetical protein